MMSGGVLGGSGLLVSSSFPSSDQEWRVWVKDPAIDSRSFLVYGICSHMT